jgi:hypothetical protein
MGMTKRYLHVIEEQTKRIVKTYPLEDDDQAAIEDDPFIGSYPQNLISGREQAQPQRDKAAAHDSNTTLPEAR